MKSIIPVLTSQYFKLQKKLGEGYPTIQEKLEELFFDYQDTPETKTVITKYFVRTEKPHSKNTPRKHTRSARLFYGRTTILVVYPKSGKIYKGRIKSLKDWCVIEPVKSDRAFWIVERKHLESNTILDLNIIPHIRQIHNKAGREFISEFR